jgi:hypothetical protein
MRYPITLSIAGVLLLSASTASANPKKEAAKHFSEGLRLYAEKNFDGAATELELSYNKNNDQTTLFAWAQAERLYGNCDESKTLLSTYVANGANAKQSKAAYDLMKQCTPRVVEPVVPEPVLTHNTSGPGDTNTNNTLDTSSGGSVNQDTGDTGKHWYKDWIGLTLLGTGGVSTALALFSYSGARSDESAAVEMGVTYDEFLHLRSEAQEKRTNSVVFGVAGGVLLSAGAAYILLDKFSAGDEEEKPSEGMVLHLSGAGGGVTWAGSF